MTIEDLLLAKKALEKDYIPSNIIICNPTDKVMIEYVKAQGYEVVLSKNCPYKTTYIIDKKK